MERFDRIRQAKGTLAPDEEALRLRCDRLVKKLKSIKIPRRREAEGYDDSNTYAVLAAKGFGLDTGTVIGFHQALRHSIEQRERELRRVRGLAARTPRAGSMRQKQGKRGAGGTSYGHET